MAFDLDNRGVPVIGGVPPREWLWSLTAIAREPAGWAWSLAVME